MGLAVARQRAHQLARSGRFDDAAKAFRHLLRQYPNDVELWLDLAHCHLERQDLPKASQCFERVLGWQPEHDQAWFGYAITLEAQHDYTRSFEAYKTVLRLNPTCVPAKQHLGGLYLLTQQYGKALQVFKALTVQQPTVTSLMGYALALDYMGHTQAAYQAYAKVLAYKHDTRHRHYIQDRMAALNPGQSKSKLQPKQPVHSTSAVKQRLIRIK
jgi:tetratricopeptide (TPR) repeat protein